MTFEQIKELIQEVAERKLRGLEVERSGFRLKIDGQAGTSHAEAGAANPAPSPSPSPTGTTAQAPGSQGTGAAATASAQGPPAPAETEPEGPAGEEGVPEDAHVLKSPIVGTFYRRPSPDDDPFVEVGSRVGQGQVLCIVEAMKLMNEIEADVAGEVVKIFPKDAQAVEYGEPLFAIRPD